jgi:integration host factor subunit beta
VELAVKTVLEHMAERLANGDRIEIRGFGSFSLHYRPGRVGRNPKTGTPVSLPAKYVPHFKPGKELRERVDEAFAHQRTSSRGVSSGAASGIMSGAAAADPAAAD